MTPEDPLPLAYASDTALKKSRRTVLPYLPGIAVFATLPLHFFVSCEASQGLVVFSGLLLILALILGVAKHRLSAIILAGIGLVAQTLFCH